MRLTPIGHEIGLIDDERYDKFLLKKEQIEKEIERLKHVNIGANKTVQELLESLGSTKLNSGSTLEELIKRPIYACERSKITGFFQDTFLRH